MNKLPLGWCTAVLSELCHRIVDGSHNPPKGVDSGRAMLSARNIINHQILFDDFRYISHEDFETENARTRIAPGDVLLTIVGTIGRTAVVPVHAEPFTLQRSVAVLKPAQIDGRYLAYAFDEPSQQQWLTDSAKGTAQKGVYLKTLGTAQIPLAPLAEQTRIVEKLEELLSDLDAGVAELKATQRKLAQYRQSLLKAAVEGALTADWRAARHKNAAPTSSFPRKRESSVVELPESLDSRLRGNDGQSEAPCTETGAELLQRILTERRARWQQKQFAKFAEQGKTPPNGWQSKYPEPVAPDIADLSSLPEGWAWATVDQLSLVQKYGSSAKTNEDSAGVPVLRMGNIQDGELDLGKLKYLPRSHDEFPDLFLEDGDLLFNRTNSPELVGKTAVFRSQIVPYSYASYLIGVRASPRCSPDFVSAYINSTYGRQWVKSVVTQQVGQANVNGSKLAALAVPLPPECEQSEITRRLVEQRQAAFEQEAMVDRALKQAAAQRKNILKAAFAGQLVPQDPHDEPASVLLERIRANRTSKAAAKLRGGKARKSA